MSRNAALASLPADPPADPDAERLRRFGEALDAIKKEAEAKLGEEDVRRLRRLDLFSNAMALTGRALIHFSFEPVGFLGGVLALWVHKQLQAIEIGHTVLHGAYDGLPGAEAWDSQRFVWDLPIEEAAWRRGHNIKHHQYTNIAGKDPDIHFGTIRLTDETPWQPHHRFQLPIALLVTFPNFGFVMNMHFTGLNDVYFGGDAPDVLPDRSWRSIVDAHRQALRKYLPYYLENYVLYPALAGPFFWKVLLGNWLAETLRDIYSAATIYCGHVGEDTAAYPEGTRARGRGQFYAMQVEATNDFEVPWPFSVLCGGLERQIEHHLFPRLPPQRLREIAPKVRAACEAHGVRYKTASWGQTLKKALAKVARLSRRAA
jgi:linoleoyl-CoA desaturase